MAFFDFKSPALPLPLPQYDARQLNELNRALRLYFNRLDNFTVPYGAFYDTTDQIAANTTTAYPITFNNTGYSFGVGISSNSHINVDTGGTYNLQYSFQFTNNTNASQDIDVWFRVNGNDVDDSNSRFGLAPRKGPSDPYHTIGAINYFMQLKRGDYIQIMWCTTDIGAYIEYYAALSSPTRPAIPSAIATAVWISS